MCTTQYHGRIAPTPTGYLHLGHAATFHAAWQRARCQPHPQLIYRCEDLDPHRCKQIYANAAIEDLQWLGIEWDAEYRQSERMPYFRQIWQQLHASGTIYPSPHSRKDVEHALQAPHAEDGESIFPAALRPPANAHSQYTTPDTVNWRFRVPDGEVIRFNDNRCGPQAFTAGEHFGDFLIWRKDGFPAYELAVVADDHAMNITEVVRGEDLLISTARQILIYRALGWQPPQWYHCPLLLDANGQRLAKRHESLSLREMRRLNPDPAAVLAQIAALRDSPDGAR